MKSGQTKYRLGLILVLGSALLFSLSGVLTKLIVAETLTIACWRGLFGGAIVLAYVGWLGRGKSIGETFRLGWRGW